MLGPESQLGTLYKCWKNEDSERYGREPDDNKCFAVKHVKKSRYYHVDSIHRNPILGQMKDENFVLRSLKHKHIVEALDILEDPTTLYLVNELCTGGTLLERIVEKKHFSEQDSAKISKQLFEGLLYMEDVHTICHCDLNPRNIFFQDKSEDSHVKVMMVVVVVFVYFFVI